MEVFHWLDLVKLVSQTVSTLNPILAGMPITLAEFSQTSAKYTK